MIAARRPVSSPEVTPTKAMNESVPPTVISPISAPPSVDIPLVPSDVSASSRIAIRPPAPAASTPATTPAAIMIAP